MVVVGRPVCLPGQSHSLPFDPAARPWYALRVGRRGALAGAAAAAAATVAVAAATAADRPVLIVNAGIGAARMGESQIQVALDYGSFCFHGCPGRVTIGEHGLTTVDYRVPGGDLVVVLRFNRVAVLRTSSPRYRTSAGLGVGSKVPPSAEWNGFRRAACADGSAVLTKSGRTVLTRLRAAHGVVTLVELRLRSLPPPKAC